MKVYRPEEVTSEIVAHLEFRELAPEELKEAYALGKAAFSVDDLLEFTEIDEGVPAHEVIAEMEQAQKQAGLRKT